MGASGAGGPGTERAARLYRVMRIGVFAAVGLLVLRFALTYRSVRVPAANDQMAPTMQPGSKVVVHRGFRRAEDFQRGDIVAYMVSVGGAEQQRRFGRVAGVPGDRIELGPRRGSARPEVRVDGERICYVAEVVTTPAERGDAGASPERVRSFVVPEATIFVVNDSRESRFADSTTVGPIAEGAFFGKVVMTSSW